jgi:hypothetical protein
MFRFGGWVWFPEPGGFGARCNHLEVVCERLQKHEEAAETGRVGNVVEGCEKQAQPLERLVGSEQ